ncbi:ribonuclease D [Methylococcus capsulatus str. Bath]|uniref:Ribonuclease D n=1 Tax=Methylococcus capsulatus (strain ATCC 33009 / NCIMB 11132 / Bath) TaxID=243233 RepID=Q605A6_METCA|nr:ribonuclease D [Methylococcus capsulatus]AAU91577.1 ribonuclease D [Methylococcus capsulatus str. Bath]
MPATMPPPINYIDSPAELAAFCRSIGGSPWIAVDTEFMRDKTYYPKFCLLQIANGTQAACIDPLAIEDLREVECLLFNRAITKVFHAARQDLEIFFHRFRAVPAPIFDTQLAAPLVGHPEQVGYASLVSAMLGVTVDKEHTRTDWSQRPLSAAQKEYAANDVIHLAALYPRMREQLERLGRYAWLVDEFAALEEPDLYVNRPEDAWQRIGGLDRLKPEQFALAVRLAAWRENTAQQNDLPRNWILRDEALLEIALRRPRNRDALQALRGIDSRMVQRYGDAMIALVQDAGSGQAVPPQPRRGQRRSAQTEAILDAMSALVRLRCIEHTINPAVVASRKDLEELLESPDGAKVLHGWRRALVGNDLRAFLAGKAMLRTKGGRLTFDDCE